MVICMMECAHTTQNCMDRGTHRIKGPAPSPAAASTARRARNTRYAARYMNSNRNSHTKRVGTASAALKHPVKPHRATKMSKAHAPLVKTAVPSSALDMDAHAT